MKWLITLAALLIAASPASAASAYCVLWPKECREIPLPAPIPPVAAPPPPAPAIERPVPVPRVKAAPKLQPKPRIKSKFTKPKRKVIAIDPSWCARVPSYATMGMIEAAASARGVTMTDAQKAQARACLASKVTQ